MFKRSQVNISKKIKTHLRGLQRVLQGFKNWHRYLSRTISVEVTSALQTSAGRMIFAKPR
ncbi:MAG: hypothetical protein IJT73_09610 [Selenomonadaceae bacterium]|nr:hypothetical protein [Selenomonadaceae bacterium]